MFSDVLYSIMERPNGALLWSVPMAHQHLLLYAAGNIMKAVVAGNNTCMSAILFLPSYLIIERQGKAFPPWVKSKDPINNMMTNTFWPAVL